MLKGHCRLAVKVGLLTSSAGYRDTFTLNTELITTQVYAITIYHDPPPSSTPLEQQPLPGVHFTL